MTESNARRRLIIVCGLPGAGKTTLAKSLEQSLQAIRFSADEWMEALSLDLYNEESRGKIEALQWTLGKELLARGLIVIVEWGPGEDQTGPVAPGSSSALALPSNSTTSSRLWMSSWGESNVAALRFRRLNGPRSRAGPKRSRHPHRRS